MDHACPGHGVARGAEPRPPVAPRPDPSRPPTTPRGPSPFPSAFGARSRWADTELRRLERLLVGLGGCGGGRGRGGRPSAQARRILAALGGPRSHGSSCRRPGVPERGEPSPDAPEREALLDLLGELLELADACERAGRHRAALALEGVQGRLLEALLCDAGPERSM
jgi:hypothetical protein